MARAAPCPSPPALQAAFGQSTEQRPGCGYPVARLLGLFHAGTGLLLKLVVAPLLTHDLAQVQKVHSALEPGDVLVGDRGLCSYAHLKELAVFAIVYNLVRMVMWHSARRQHTDVERISFLDALRWFSAPSTGIPLGALLVNPIRPHRVEPRVKKRRPKSFPLMIKPRQELHQQLLQLELRG
jgi:hypothetical protein